MRVVIDSLVGLVTGLFTLGEADLATIGINMIMGLSMFFPMTVGQLSFGQAGVMSIGAHIAVVLTLYDGVWFPVALLLAGVGTSLVGFLVGVPVLRLRGLLLALLTYTVFGGIDVWFGGVLGAAVLSYLPMLLQVFDHWRLEIHGAILLRVMPLRPQGVLSLDLSVDTRA